MTRLNDRLAADHGMGLDLGIGHGLVRGAAANDAGYGNWLQSSGAKIGAAGIGVNLELGRNLTGYGRGKEPYGCC